MDPVERKLARLFEALAEENQRLLELLDAGCTLAEAERKLAAAMVGATRCVALDSTVPTASHRVALDLATPTAAS